MNALRRASDRRGIETTTLPSGGEHDSMKVAKVTDVGMLFARSRDGVSHSPAEWTDWKDCTEAVGILATALADVACETAHGGSHD